MVLSSLTRSVKIAGFLLHPYKLLFHFPLREVLAMRFRFLNLPAGLKFSISKRKAKVSR